MMCAFLVGWLVVLVTLGHLWPVPVGSASSVEPGSLIVSDQIIFASCAFSISWHLPFGQVAFLWRWHSFVQRVRNLTHIAVLLALL